MKLERRNSMRKLASKAKKYIPFNQSTVKISPFLINSNQDHTDDEAKYETFKPISDFDKPEDNQQQKAIIRTNVNQSDTHHYTSHCASTDIKTTERPSVSVVDTCMADIEPTKDCSTSQNSLQLGQAIAAAINLQINTRVPTRRASMTAAITSSASLADTFNGDVEPTTETYTPQSSGQDKLLLRSNLKKASSGRFRVHRRASMTHVRSTELRSALKKPSDGNHRPHRRASISFAATNEVQEVAPISSLTDHPEELWIQRDEYNRIRDKISLVVKVAGCCEDHQKVCTRGLESMMKGPSSEKRDAFVSVMQQQGVQRDEGKNDAEGMAMAYEAMSRESQLVARIRAMEDANAIKSYMKSTKRRMRRMSVF